MPGARVIAHGPGSTGERESLMARRDHGVGSVHRWHDGDPGGIWEGGGWARSSICGRWTAPRAIGRRRAVALSPDKQWSCPHRRRYQLNLVPPAPGGIEWCRGRVQSFRRRGWLFDDRAILFPGPSLAERPRVYLQSIESGEPRRSHRRAFGRIAISADGKASVTRGTDRRLAIVTIDGADVRPLAAPPQPADREQR